MTSAQVDLAWLISILSPDLIRSIGWALIHFLWQGAALLLVFLAVQRSIRTAVVRYAFAYGTLLAMAAAPIATFCLLRGDADPATTLMFAVSRPAAVHWMGWLVSAWIFGVAVLSLRLAGGWYRAVTLSRSGTPLPATLLDRCNALRAQLLISRPVRFLQSAAVHTPAVVGWLRPVVLIPASAVLGLSAAQLEAVILHELAHIRRFDFIANIGQAVVEIALFYHPAVWWISRRIRIEREHCCDDIAVLVSGDVLTYARTLADLAERRTLPSLAMAASGGHLTQRISRLLGIADRPNHSSVLSAFGIALVCIAVFFAATAKIPQPAARAVTIAPVAPTPIVVVVPQVVPAPVTVALVSPMPTIRVAQASAPAPAHPLLVVWPQLGAREIATLEDLGVTPDYMLSLKNAGIDLSELTPFDMVAYKTAGVTPELIQALRSMNLKELKASHYPIAQIVGLTPEFLGKVRKHNFSNLTLEVLIAFKNNDAFG
jgi:beta-lactamase regulating signal transducer with metallopeptidase domain